MWIWRFNLSKSSNLFLKVNSLSFSSLNKTLETDFLTKIIQNERNNPLFTEASTILEVVNESINNNLKITPDMPSYDTALFGALLKQLQLMVHNDKYDHTGAYILLFQYILQKVNPTVKQSAIGTIEKTLTEIIKNVPKNTIPEKYIISMYYNILQIKPPVEWFRILPLSFLTLY